MNQNKLMLTLTLILLGVVPALAQMGHMGRQIDRNLIFPHLALGAGYVTTLVLMNPGESEQITGVVHFYDQQGNPWSVLYDGGTVSQIDVALPAGGSRYVQVTGTTETLQVGWALFETQVSAGGSGMGSGMGSGINMDPHGHVFGSVIFTHLSGTTVDAQVGVLGTLYQMGYFMGISVPVMVGGDVDTGVAAVNAGAVSAEVKFALIDPDGNKVTEVSRTLAAGNQMAYMLTDLFPSISLSSFDGSLEIRTVQEGVVSMGLLVTGDVLTSIPVIHIPDSMPGSGMGTAGTGGNDMHDGGSRHM